MNELRLQRERLLAFLATSYLVKTVTGPKIIRAGQPHHWLDALLPAPGEWYYICSANPASEILPNSANRARHAQLLAWLRARGHWYLPGYAFADDENWPPEDACLVVAPGEEVINHSREELGQLAVVTGRFGSRATLNVLNPHWCNTATTLAARGLPVSCDLA